MIGEGSWPSDYHAYFSFSGTNIPEGGNVTILSATIALTTWDVVHNATMAIYGLMPGEGMPPASAAGANGWELSSASVGWTNSGWSTNTKYTSSSIVSCIQEIVNDAGWQDTQDINIVIKCTFAVEQERTYYRTNEYGSSMAELAISWTT